MSPWFHRSLSRYQFGIIAEIWVALFLFFKAYHILAIRKRTPMGEIDILAKKGDTLIIMEVKARQSHAHARAAISKHQRARLIRASQYIQAGNPHYAPLAIRFDCCTVSWYMGVHHIQNAFIGE